MQVEARLLTNIGSWRHLIGRFFRVVRARSLDPTELEWVRRYVEAEIGAFLAQSRADQRHGYQAARRVGDRREMVRAALLHDIGKRHARLSAVGRSLVSSAAKLGMPVGRRGATYLDHGRLGAEELTRLGAGQLVVEFARHHHGERPATIDASDWQVLVAADR